MNDLQERLPSAMEQVATDLPADFPKHLRRSLYSGIEERLKIMAAQTRG